MFGGCLQSFRSGISIVAVHTEFSLKSVPNSLTSRFYLTTILNNVTNKYVESTDKALTENVMIIHYFFSALI